MTTRRVVTISPKLAEDIKKKKGENTYQQTANDIGITKSVLHKIMKGGNPDFRTYILLTKWLGVELNEYL
jgi:DNA-binding phage protein